MLCHFLSPNSKFQVVLKCEVELGNKAKIQRMNLSIMELHLEMSRLLKSRCMLHSEVRDACGVEVT